jgi:hypothetical protein
MHSGMRAVLALSIVVGASTTLAACADTINVCNVDQQVDSVSAEMGVMDCGRFYRGDVNYTDGAMLAAQLCVLNAINNHASFRLVYDADPTTGPTVAGLRAGFVGTFGFTTIDQVDMSIPDGQSISAVTVSLRSYAGRGGGDMASKDDLVSIQPCQSIDATQSCKPRVGTPCLTCTPPPAPRDIATVQCRG